MAQQLTLSVGQATSRGRKPLNQDAHGAVVPLEPLLATKGAVLALADGIGSSDVSHIASRTAVAAFLTDYYATPEAWAVKTAAERVLAATNAWLVAQTLQGRQRVDQDRGYVCTLSAMVIKSGTAHLFHVGDARICRVHGGRLEQLTTDHRLWISPQRSYLSRALGVQAHLEIDYRSLPLEAGELFMLATDGVHEVIDGADVRAAIDGASDLDGAAQQLVARALEKGSTDNLTVQLVRIESLRARELAELLRQLDELPLPPPLAPRAEIDGYRILRELHAGSRSHVHLALDAGSGARVAIKTPSTELAADRAQLARFALEAWILGRIDSPHVVKLAAGERPRCFVYLATEYIDGMTLAQWMRDHPKPGIDAVRRIAGQVAKGLRALHRLEMLHQDLRPENVMLDASGTAIIIDVGAVRVAGLAEMATGPDDGTPPGDALHAAPETLLGEPATVRSDVFALGMLTYRMLTGALPYGVGMPGAKSCAEQRRLAYTPAHTHDASIPDWVDAALGKALQADPARRHGDVAEFIHDLHHPNPAFLARRRPALVERDPLVFWKGLSFALLLLLLGDLALR